MLRRAAFLVLGWLAVAPAASAAPQVSDLLRLPALRGDALTAKDLAGRVVVVTFFASWCPPCREEFPHLNRVQQAFRDAGLRVIAVNVFETFDGLSTPAKLARFLDEMAPDFPVLRGDPVIRRAFFDLDRIPSLFVFDRGGRLATMFRHERGATRTHLSQAELEAMVVPLLATGGDQP